MAATIDLDYNYAFASEMSPSSTSQRKLSLATSGGAEKNPFFFTGRFNSPKQSADLLLALSTISRTRFFSPGELRERMKAAADPVVTSDGNQLRFEVFSVCCGVYGRLDLHNNAFAGDWIGKGTTNVDFNPAIRAALGSVMTSDEVALRVGADRVELERAGHTSVERKVKLPVRWLKSFVEVQVYQSMLKKVIELPQWELAKILRKLPQQNILQAGTITYLVPTDKAVRLSQREAPGSVAVGAISRLKILEPILRYADSVRIYGGDNAVSAFELKFAEGSFFFVLSPNAARGFSGEGQALSGLSSESSSDAIDRVRSALVWQRDVDTKELSSALGIEKEKVFGALQVLGTRGLAGFDLASGKFFHRELPFDLSLIEKLQPRMKKARQLFDRHDVRLVKLDNDEYEAYVKGTTVQHFVKVSADGSKCTCDWFTKHQGERGPCSHVLAADLAVDAMELN